MCCGCLVEGGSTQRLASQGVRLSANAPATLVMSGRMWPSGILQATGWYAALVAGLSWAGWEVFSRMGQAAAAGRPCAGCACGSNGVEGGERLQWVHTAEEGRQDSCRAPCSPSAQGRLAPGAPAPALSFPPPVAHLIMAACRRQASSATSATCSRLRLWYDSADGWARRTAGVAGRYCCNTLVAQWQQAAH